MEYKIGDKVLLENGKVVTISNITSAMGQIVYASGNPYCVITQKIIRKID
ncbi:MAG: hypothetical protein HFJ45_02660 [Clostridia bacterium]|nr:hypothetical protein [Clostridia bacterium]